MCTMIAEQATIKGSGKAGSGWFKVDLASVSYDHPFDMALEYTLNLDFTNQAGEPGSRVAVEMDWKSAQKLVALIQSAMRQAEEGGFVEASSI
jgi:hypothetical protein